MLFPFQEKTESVKKKTYRWLGDWCWLDGGEEDAVVGGPLKGLGIRGVVAGGPCFLFRQVEAGSKDGVLEFVP